MPFCVTVSNTPSTPDDVSDTLCPDLVSAWLTAEDRVREQRGLLDLGVVDAASVLVEDITTHAVLAYWEGA